MKTLYVEDEYAILIEKIPELWGACMTPEESEQWNALVKNPYSGCQEIKELFSNNPFLNVEFDFLDALKLFESDDIKQYDFFVLDRCLETKEQGISFEDILEVCPQLTKHDYDYITAGEGREGDFLLKRLFYKMGNKIQRKVFFLSGHLPDDVFGENDVLQHIIDDEKILTKEDYIEKGEKDGIKRLKEIIAFDEEEMLIYEKWGGVLSHFNKLKDGWRIKRAIMSALMTNGKESIDSYYNSILFLNELYIDFFEEKIGKQKSKFVKDKQKTNTEDEKEKQEYKNKWYSKDEVIIPRNIIETSEIIWRIRNNCVHRIEQGRKIDISGLTVLTCAYAALELTRFWQEKGWELNPRGTVNKVKE